MHPHRTLPSTSGAFNAVFSVIRRVALIAALFLCLPVESGTFDRGDFSFIKSAHAGIVVRNPGDTVFRPNARTEIVVLGTTTVVDAQGVPHTVEESRKNSLICGGNVRDAAGVESPVLPPNSLPDDFFSDDDEPGEETTWTYSVPPGGPFGFSAGGASSGPTFVITVKGTPPDGAEAAVARVFERYLFHFDDDVTIRITMKWEIIELDENGDAPIGSSRTEYSTYSYNTVRAALNLDMDSDDVLQSSLPIGSLPVVYDASGTVNETRIRVTKAGAKAAGLRNPHHSGEDGRIIINTDFRFDFDPYDGILPGRMDFELVLLHEVGHMLGFSSSVDFRKKDVESIDLFRFSVSNCASSASNFGTRSRTASKDQQPVAARSCLPFEIPALQMSTGEENGDGNQASHWNGFLGYLGMMIPGISGGDAHIQDGLFGFEYVTSADLRAFDFIGWDYVPVDTTLGNVVLSAPADKSVFVSTTPTLSWTHASNAFDYQLSIFKSPGSGSELDAIQTVNVAGLSYPVPSGLLEPNTTYLWRVEARNPYRSEKSSVWQFTTSAFDPLLGPVAFGLFAPVSGALNEPRTPDMQWDHIPGPNAATSYTIQIDDEANFEEPHVFQYAGIAPGPSPVTFSVPPRILRNGQAYFWRVTGFNGAGSQVAGGGSFTVGSFAPSDFGALTPRMLLAGTPVEDVDQETYAFLAATSATSTFSWQPAWEAEGYTLQVDDDENFSSPVISHSTNQTTYTPSPGLLLSSTAYWWRVLATNSAGTIVSSPSSATFTTSPPAPGTFSAIAPANGSTTSSNAPILQWSSSENATQYIVEIGQDPFLQHPEVTMVASGADADGILVPLGLLQSGQTYYWRVTSLNSAGFTETDTDTFHFIMGSGGIGVPGIPVGSAAAFALALILALTGVVLSNHYARADHS